MLASDPQTAMVKPRAHPVNGDVFDANLFSEEPEEDLLVSDISAVAPHLTYSKFLTMQVLLWFVRVVYISYDNLTSPSRTSGCLWQFDIRRNAG